MAVGEGMVGVTCSETTLGEGDRVLGGAAALCVGAEAVGWPRAEGSAEAGAGPADGPDAPDAPPTKGLRRWGAGAL